MFTAGVITGLLLAVTLAVLTVAWWDWRQDAATEARHSERARARARADKEKQQ